MKQHILSYLSNLHSTLETFDWQVVEDFAEVLLNTVRQQKQFFICGNGGSAGNAMHLANDFLYGIEPGGKSLRVEALPSNAAVLTCLGNDLGYDDIFAHQLLVKAQPEDVLLVLSGSGNSANIIKALEMAKSKGVITAGILGYSGGKAAEMVDYNMHFAIDDMQISEDTQLIVGHMLMQHLNSQLKQTSTSE
jgi:D-sedoheptulose 7-phosphate isomerase